MSPVAVTVQLNGLPTVTPLVGHETVTVSAVPATFAIVEPVPVEELPSRAVALMLYEPLAAQVTEIVLTDEVPLQPVARVHVKL